MPRVLKVFQTHIGFYDLVVAAPSMKAAADVWHASPRLFARGFAAPTNDNAAVAAALAQPGIVLKRPHGKHAPWKAEPETPEAPKLTAQQKRRTATETKESKQREAAQKKAQAEAAKHARAAAKDELSEIEEQEAQLRQRRQALRRKFHLRSV